LDVDVDGYLVEGMVVVGLRWRLGDARGESGSVHETPAVARVELGGVRRGKEPHLRMRRVSVRQRRWTGYGRDVMTSMRKSVLRVENVCG
jgi:hypothetical protein